MSDLVTVSVPGLPAAGPVTGNELVAVHQNGRLVKIPQRTLSAGGAAFLDRVASVALTRGTVVASLGATEMQPADIFDDAHCGRVLGILVDDTARGVTGRVQSLGPMSGVAVPTSTGGDALLVGEGGALVRELPPGAAWRQIVARADAATDILITLGEAALLDNAADAMLAEGGFSTPCPLDRAADREAGGYVTPAANARAFAAVLCGAVPDGLPPRRGQFLLALEAMQAGSIQKLLDALPASPADPVNVAWFHTVGVVASGRLASFAKQVLALTDTQIATAIVSARSTIE